MCGKECNHVESFIINLIYKNRPKSKKNITKIHYQYYKNENKDKIKDIL